MKAALRRPKIRIRCPFSGFLCLLEEVQIRPNPVYQIPGGEEESFCRFFGRASYDIDHLLPRSFPESDFLPFGKSGWYRAPVLRFVTKPFVIPTLLDCCHVVCSSFPFTTLPSTSSLRLTCLPVNTATEISGEIVATAPSVSYGNVMCSSYAFFKRSIIVSYGVGTSKEVRNEGGR